MSRRFRLLLAVPLIAVLAVGPAPSEADPVVLPDPLAPIDSDHLLSCTQLVPHAVSLESTRVRLDLRILLDGVSRADADRSVRAMRTAYAPLAIRVVPTYERVSFKGRDAEKLTAQAKRLYHGKRPRGVDIVYTMTSKDITAAGVLGDNVAGLADCIGGVRYANHAFAVGEKFDSAVDTGKCMAHEVGHLLGGHHHYTSVEGLLGPEANVLDLMGPSLSLISLRFSTLNSLMVRAHAQRYAG